MCVHVLGQRVGQVKITGKMEELALSSVVELGQGGAVGVRSELPAVEEEKEKQPGEDHDHTSIKYCCRQ